MIRIIFLLLGLFPFIAEAESFDMGIFHYDTLESNPDEVSITYYTGPDEFKYLRFLNLSSIMARPIKSQKLRA